MSESIQDIAAIDTVCSFFESIIAALTPSSEQGKPFHLLGEESGLLRDQPLLVGFYRQFDVRFSMDSRSGESYLPLERVGSVMILIGYLGSMRDRRIDKIMRQDEELIARHLLAANVDSPANQPFDWDIAGPGQIEELDNGSACILGLTYNVSYVCDEVT